MGESETISWIKSQLNAGYSRPQIKEMLINSGYEPENAEKILDLAVGRDSESGNSAPDAAGPDSAHEQKDEVHEESWITVGGYAGICASVAFVVLFLTMVFFDNYGFIKCAFLIVLLDAFIIANRSSRASIKKITGSVFVSYASLLAVMIASLYFFIYYIYYSNSNMLHSTPVLVVLSDGLQFIGDPSVVIIILIIAIISGIIVLQAATLIIRHFLKKNNTGKINVLKPIVILGGLYVLGMGLFCFTGPKIAHEPIEVYWCEKDGGELYKIEELYELGLVPITGYSSESYFTQAPNTNNRFAMNKYELATALLTSMNSASINYQSLYVASKFDEMNLTDEYYDSVIKESEFKLNELEQYQPDEKLIQIIDSYNSYLSNLKKIIEKYDIDYKRGKDDMFKDREQHLKYIQTKIDINNGLKKSYEYMKLYEDNELKKGYYANIKIEVINSIISDYPARIKITDVSFDDTQSGSLLKIVVKVKNVGKNDITMYDITRSRPDSVSLDVDGVPAGYAQCDFERAGVLRVHEESTCSGMTDDDESLPKTIILSWPGGFGATYLYEGE